MKQEISIVKLGGTAIDNKEALDNFLCAFAAIPGNKILVHGGGKIATAIGSRLGLQAQYSNGRRITDASTLELVTMVYAGLLNKNIVAQLQKANCNAIGLSGADGNSIQTTKRESTENDFGFVGDMKAPCRCKTSRSITAPWCPRPMAASASGPPPTTTAR